MSDLTNRPAPGPQESAPSPAAGGALATTAEAPLPERFEDPGLPPHRPRLADTDPAAARRAERQVAGLFVLSIVGTVLTIVGYFAFPLEDAANLQLETRYSTIVIGLGIFLTLFGIGAGAVHWAKVLMPDHEEIEERHSVESTPEQKAEAAELLREGVAESGIARRPLIRNTLVGAVALAPLPAVVLLKDTGPNPGTALYESIWSSGVRLVKDPSLAPLRADEVQLGSITHVVPENLEGSEHYLEEKAKAAVIVMRLPPEEVAPEAVPGSVDGILAYSKICTHMGCPVALYEQQTEHLLCPCHQSTFDVRQNCAVIFGPAKRALPQLPIAIGDDGVLVATDGFAEPPGPSFWERG